MLFRLKSESLKTDGALIRLRWSFIEDVVAVVVVENVVIALTMRRTVRTNSTSEPIC